MRTTRLAKLALVVALVSVLVGCTSLLNPRNFTPLKPDSSSQANFQALNAQLGDSCSAPILEPERSALIQEALADSQLQAVKAQLEGRGLGMNADEAQAVRLVGGEQLLIPFGQDAHLVWTRTNGQTAAVGLIRQGNKTLNVGADGQERVVRFLNTQQAEKLLRKLRERSKFQEFEGKLAQRGKRVGRVRVLLDETNKLAILGIALEGNEEKISHQVRIRVKANREDEPEDDAEPAIQATACGQASGEAVPLGAKMQPLRLDAGEGGDITGGYNFPEGRDYSYDYICTSQWGYVYDCRRIAPILRVTTSSLLLPLAIIPDPVQASFVVWNYGGGTLQGTVSVPAPFSIVSGGSFSLAPGQPQEVVVRFTPAASGVFSQSATITSNGGNTAVSLTARAITYEEYLQLNIQVYNTMAESGAYPGLGVWNRQRSRALLVAGAPRMTLESFQELETSINAETDAYLDQQPLDPRLARFFDELNHVNARALNRWLGLLQEAIAQGRFEAEYQRLRGEGLVYVERAVMAWLATSNTTQAQQLIYRLAQSGWRAPELAQQQYPSEYLEQLRQLMERMLWNHSLVELLAQIASELGLMPGPVRAFFELVNAFKSILSLLGDEESCNSVGECIARFMEEAYRATLRMLELRFSSSEVSEFARSLLEIMRAFAQRENFAYQWGNVFGLLIWMNQGGHARYDRGFGTIVATARILHNMPSSSVSGWSASLVGIVHRNNGTWWGAVMIFSYPTIGVNPRDGIRYAGVVGGDHCQNCSAIVSDIVNWIQQALFEVQRQMTIHDTRGRGLVAFAFTNPGANIGAVLDALIARFGNSAIPIIVSWTTSDGRVFYMCIGTASACAALGDLARQIACAQQGQWTNCNAQEVDWRISPWEAPPPQQSTPVVRFTP